MCIYSYIHVCVYIHSIHYIHILHAHQKEMWINIYTIMISAKMSYFHLGLQRQNIQMLCPDTDPQIQTLCTVDVQNMEHCHSDP